MKKIVSLLLITIISINYVLSQSPKSFKYQAVLRNSAGEVIQNQTVAIKINILQGSINGTNAYIETHSTTTNQFGLVNLNIGEGTSSNDFSTIDWSSGPYFLKVELDASGTFTEIGTSQLLSVPYALYAKKAGEAENTFSGSYNDLSNQPSFQDSIDTYGFSGDYGDLTHQPNIPDSIGKYGFSGNYENLTDKPNFFHHQTDRSNIQFRPFPNLDKKGVIIGKYPNAEIYSVRAWDWSETNSFPLKLGIYGRHLYLNDAEGWNVLNVGIGVSRTTTPASKLEVANGDIFISDVSGGVIMKSPNGNCWRVTIDNNGDFVKTQITCPQGE